MNPATPEPPPQCSQCGANLQQPASRCPECGSLNSKLDNLLAEEEAERFNRTLNGRMHLIWAADDRKAEFFNQVDQLKSSLTAQTYWVLLFVFAFVFALVISVM